MPVYGPVSRRELIATLRRLGWDGPYTAVASTLST